ncbi:unnamed protein product, partial [Aphanomyces euteiches]
MALLSKMSPTLSGRSSSVTQHLTLESTKGPASVSKRSCKTASSVTEWAGPVNPFTKTGSESLTTLISRPSDLNFANVLGGTTLWSAPLSNDAARVTVRPATQHNSCGAAHGEVPIVNTLALYDVASNGTPLHPPQDSRHEDPVLPVANTARNEEDAVTNGNNVICTTLGNDDEPMETIDEEETESDSIERRINLRVNPKA